MEWTNDSVIITNAGIAMSIMFIPFILGIVLGM